MIPGNRQAIRRGWDEVTTDGSRVVGRMTQQQQPSLVPIPVRTSLSGRSPARDALQRISRQIPARPARDDFKLSL
jgi:hypothetical protein